MIRALMAAMVVVGGIGLAPIAVASNTGPPYANCDEARADGASDILRGDPGYRAKLDRDDDGIACES